MIKKEKLDTIKSKISKGAKTVKDTTVKVSKSTYDTAKKKTIDRYLDDLIVYSRCLAEFIQEIRDVGRWDEEQIAEVLYRSGMHPSEIDEFCVMYDDADEQVEDYFVNYFAKKEKKDEKNV